MNEPIEKPEQPGFYPFGDTFRWLDSLGFEHMTNIRARTFGELVYQLADAATSILESGGTPLIGANLRPTNEPLPRADAPETQYVQEREGGVPVLDGNSGEPKMVKLPEGSHLFTVKEVFRDVSANGGESKFKVVIEEQGYEWANGKWGITCFHPEAFFKNWKAWEVGKRKAPPEGAEKVVVRDPKPGGRFAEVVDFRSA